TPQMKPSMVPVKPVAVWVPCDVNSPLTGLRSSVPSTTFWDSKKAPVVAVKMPASWMGTVPFFVVTTTSPLYAGCSGGGPGSMLRAVNTVVPLSGPFGMTPAVQIPTGLVQPSMKKVETIVVSTRLHSPARAPCEKSTTAATAGTADMGSLMASAPEGANTFG